MPTRAPTPHVVPDVRGRGRARTRVLIAVGVLAVALRLVVVEPTSISSDSMHPTLDHGDRVLVDTLAPRLGHRPGRNELITFTSPADGETALKRVVGVAGDLVRIDDGVLIVNDRTVLEPYVDQVSIDALYWGPVTVPADHVLVLGDARAGSIDSRTYGPLPLTAVRGRVLMRLWPAPAFADELSHPANP